MSKLSKVNCTRELKKGCTRVSFDVIDKDMMLQFYASFSDDCPTSEAIKHLRTLADGMERSLK